MTDLIPTLREQAERFPQAPDHFFELKGQILYIGKAKTYVIDFSIHTNDRWQTYGD